MKVLQYLIANELRSWARNRSVQVLSIAMLVLLIVTSWLGIQRVNDLESERVAAAASDRDVWINQGEANPHSAAHFSRYAFKPIPALAHFDPGVLDFSGAAIWMEGHYQNPAQYRRIEDAPLGARVANLSPSYVLLLFGSLIIVIALYGSIAGEREDNTLRQVLVSGVSDRTLVAAKVIASLLLVLGLTVVGLVISSVFMFMIGSVDMIEPDVLLRVSGLVLIYLLFFLAVAGISIGISATASDRRDALGKLLSLWVAVLILGPYIAVESALHLHPDPDGRTTYQQIVNASNSYFQDSAARESVLQQALQEYGVDSRDELPFRYDGYELQKSEEIAHPKFNEIYSQVNKTYEGQETILSLFSIFIPRLVVEKLSAGFAGSDRIHHEHFRHAAEMHRRTIVKMMNDNLAFANPDHEGPYRVGREVWETIPDFEMDFLQINALFPDYLVDLLVLLIQAALAITFAFYSLSAATRQVK